MIRPAIVVCVVAMLGQACATRGSVRALGADLRDVHSELGSLRQAQETLARQVQDATATAQAAQAATDDVRVASARTNEQVGRLTSRVDATEANVKQTDEKLTKLAAAPTPPPPAPAASPAVSVSEPPRERLPRAADASFAAGLTSFRAREYGQAILYFLDVVTRYPTHELAPVAQYWIAESYYLQHDFRQALVEFRKVVEWPSSNAKMPDALVKIGLCYGRLNEVPRAHEAWRRAIREYPGSSAAAQARELLASGRSPGRR